MSKNKHGFLYQITAFSLILGLIVLVIFPVSVYATNDNTYFTMEEPTAGVMREEPFKEINAEEPVTEPTVEPPTVAETTRPKDESFEDGATTETSTEPVTTEATTEAATEAATEPTTDDADSESGPAIGDTGITVKEKIDLLLKRLGVTENGTVYFTVNQSACSSSRKGGHGCNNCNISNIVNASWFKKIFGNVNVNMFPPHNSTATTGSNRGWSCFGFACFAQWYIFTDDSAEKLDGKCVATIRFNKDAIESTVKPGDVLRVNSSHSMIVYSVEEDGVVVVDSNWNMGGQLNCVVQKHLISYNSSYKNDTTFVCRVTKTSELEDGMAGEFGTGDWWEQGGTSDDTNTSEDDSEDDSEYIDNTDKENSGEWVYSDDGKWYYIDTNKGTMASGWVYSEKSGLWYYMNPEGKYMLSDWWLCDLNSGRWYYLGSNGAMCTGWMSVDDVWYYFDDNGAMCTGWNIINGNWYLFGSNGIMLTGWQEVNGKFYYLTEEGVCLINMITPDGYIVDETGARVDKVAS